MRKTSVSHLYLKPLLQNQRANFKAEDKVKFSKRNFLSKKFPCSILFLVIAETSFSSLQLFHKNWKFADSDSCGTCLYLRYVKTKDKTSWSQKKILNNFLKILSEKLFWNEKFFFQRFCLRNICFISLHNSQSPNELKILHKLFRKTIKKEKTISVHSPETPKNTWKIKTPQREIFIFLLD